MRAVHPKIVLTGVLGRPAVREDRARQQLNHPASDASRSRRAYDEPFA